MTIEAILLIYGAVTGIVLLITGLFIITTTEHIPEIDNVYDWLFYGIFWVFILIKYMIKFFYKLIKT